MKKASFFMCAFLFLAFSILTTAYARDLKLVIKESDCIEDGKVSIRFGVINNRKIKRYNIGVGFKILKEERPVGCKEIKLQVPQGSDGSVIHETIIDAPCDGKSVLLRSMVFHNVKRYKVEQWFAGCP